MKINEVKVVLDNNAFEPVLQVQLDIELAVIEDKNSLLSEDEFATIIGTEFLSQLKEKLINNKIGD